MEEQKIMYDRCRKKYIEFVGGCNTRIAHFESEQLKEDFHFNFGR